MNDNGSSGAGDQPGDDAGAFEVLRVSTPVGEAPAEPPPPGDEQPILEEPAGPDTQPPPPRTDETEARVDEGEAPGLKDAVSALFQGDFEAGDPGTIEGGRAPVDGEPVAPRGPSPTEAKVVVTLQIVVDVKVGPIRVSVTKGGSDAGRR